MDFAAAQAYYTMFYVAQAFLLEKEQAYSKHTGTIAAFSREFCRTGLVPAEFHQYLKQAQVHRHHGHYGTGEHLSDPIVESLLTQARQFLEVAERRYGAVSEDHQAK